MYKTWYYSEPLAQVELQVGFQLKMVHCIETVHDSTQAKAPTKFIFGVIGDRDSPF